MGRLFPVKIDEKKLDFLDFFCEMTDSANFFCRFGFSAPSLVSRHILSPFGDKNWEKSRKTSIFVVFFIKSYNFSESQLFHFSSGL